jgi:hypothetical protein
VIVAVVALAAALTATDAATDMTFTLSGRSLTVKVGPGTPAKVKRQLNGKQVVFDCARTHGGRMTGTHTRPITWTRGAMSMRVTLPKALAHADACGIEKPNGEDISWGLFGS